MANERLYALCSELGMRKGVSWHWIRHSRATHLREDDVRLEDIGSLLRHRSSATTLIYASTDTEKLRKNVNKNDILGAKVG
jgi:site-specific recombinase XerD